MNYLATGVLHNILEEGDKTKEDKFVFFNYDTDTISLITTFDLFTEILEDDLSIWIGDKEFLITANQKDIIHAYFVKWIKEEKDSEYFLKPSNRF